MYAFVCFPSCLRALFFSSLLRAFISVLRQVLAPLRPGAVCLAPSVQFARRFPPARTTAASHCRQSAPRFWAGCVCQAGPSIASSPEAGALASHVVCPVARTACPAAAATRLRAQQRPCLFALLAPLVCPRPPLPNQRGATGARLAPLRVAALSLVACLAVAVFFSQRVGPALPLPPVACSSHGLARGSGGGANAPRARGLVWY